MLVEFRVENFMNFKQELVFRLDQVKNYESNRNAIRNGIVKTGMIYGGNGSGKTNLGLGLFDLTVNLNDNVKNNYYNNRPLINLSSKGNARFYYKFKFNKSYLEYLYEKDNDYDIITEEMLIDGKKVIYYDHQKQSGEVFLKGTETLNINLNEKNISFVKYIRSNSVLLDDKVNHVFNEFIHFVDHMLLISSLERNHNKDNKKGRELITNQIIEKGKLKDFELFLKRFGIAYKLSVEEIDGHREICCCFNENKVKFYDIASSGTYTLALFYYWLIELENVSFVFIDEFDAYYHNKIAHMVVKEVLKSDVQGIMSAHNTSMIDNDLLRPDCYFNLVNENIKSFAYSTDKELRKAHNLEKMYRAGSFN